MSIKLTDKDICRGRLNGTNGTHCAVGWARTLFTTKRPQRTFINMFPKVAADIFNIEAYRHYSVFRLNDAQLAKKQTADCINETLSRMGYEIVEVEE